MDTLSYILLAIALIVFIRPILFKNDTPIPETSKRVFKVTQAAELDAVLASTTSVVVDFYADWCPPCRAIAPIFSKLAEDYTSSGQLAFVKVNVDHVRDVAARYNISAMPTFLFFRDGVPHGVTVEGLKSSRSVNLTDDGSVARILGADRAALQTVVQALAAQRHG